MTIHYTKKGKSLRDSFGVQKDSPIFKEIRRVKELSAHKVCDLMIEIITELSSDSGKVQLSTNVVDMLFGEFDYSLAQTNEELILIGAELTVSAEVLTKKLNQIQEAEDSKDVLDPIMETIGALGTVEQKKLFASRMIDLMEKLKTYAKN